jgi:peptide/nickel transport system permease protein
MTMAIPTGNPLTFSPWHRLRHHRSGMTGLMIVSAFGLLALAAAAGLAGSGWWQANGPPWQAPGMEFWFGTNRVGQDIFARAVHSTATAFEIGLVVAAGSTLTGAVLGGLAGWYSPGWVDESVLWLKGVLDSIPYYLFVAAIAFAMNGSPWAMHLGMVATFWTGTGRLVRGEVIRLREREFVDAARAIGIPGPLIVARHILPNTVHILLVQFTLVFVAAIKTEVILSFLGIGVQGGISWGVMLAESSQEVLAGHFGNFLAASGFLFLFLMGFNLLSDALQDTLDIRGQAT